MRLPLDPPLHAIGAEAPRACGRVRVPDLTGLVCEQAIPWTLTQSIRHGTATVAVRPMLVIASWWRSVARSAAHTSAARLRALSPRPPGVESKPSTAYVKCRGHAFTVVFGWARALYSGAMDPLIGRVVIGNSNTNPGRRQ